MEPQKLGEKNVEKTSTKKGFAIVSLIMGILSMLCCCMLGLGIIPAIVGIILGLIAVIRGEGSSRVIGGIGLGLSAVGFVLGIWVVITFVTHVNWENLTMENLSKINDIDKNDKYQVAEWLQQFFNGDISISNYVN